jgi:two-component system, cell cycle sensor histidine kinase and response regulator CckA
MKSGGTNRLLAAALDAVSDAMFVVDLQGICIYCNAVGTRLLKMPADEIVGQHFASLFSESAVEQFRRSEQRVVRTGNVQSDLCVIENESGRWSLQITRSPYQDDRETMLGVIYKVQVVTNEPRPSIVASPSEGPSVEQVEIAAVTSAEKSLPGSSRVDLFQKNPQLSAFFHLVNDGIVVISVECNPASKVSGFRIVAVSPAFCRITKLTENQIVGRLLEEVVVDSQLQSLLSCCFQAIETRQVAHWSEPSSCLSGGYLYALNFLAIYAPTGECTHLIGAARDLESSHPALAAAEASEERYRSLIAAMAEGVVVHQANGEIVTCNKSAERILGLDASQICGRTSLDPRWRAIHKDGSPFLGHDHPAMVTLKTGKSMSKVLMGVHAPNGSLSWIEINSEPFFLNREKEPYGVVCSFSDMTERENAKDKLRENELLLLEAQRIARIGSWGWEPASGNTWWSATIYELFGVDSACVQPSYESFLSLVHPEDLPIAKQRVEAMLAGQHEFANDLRIIRPDGECVWLHSRARATRDSAGNIIRVEGTDQDITDRKRAEIALRESEKRLRVALEAASSIAFEWDVKSDSLTRYYSVEPTLPANMEHTERVADVWARVHPDDQATFAANVQACLECGNDYRGLYRVIRSDGSVVWLEEWGTLERSADGEPLRLIGISIDVTERKRADAELRRTSALLEAVVSETTDAVFVKDREGKYLLFNEAASRFVGRPIQEVLGNDDTLLFGDADADFVMKRDARIMSSGEVETIEETLTANGQTRTYWATKGPYYDESGVIVGVIGIAHDITDRKVAERKLKLIQFGIDHVSDTILWVDAVGQLLNVNEATCRTLGFERTALIGQHISRIAPQYFAGAWEALWESLKCSGSETVESTFTTCDGNLVDVEIKHNYVRFEEQEIDCIVARNITERKNSQKRMATQHAVVSILAHAADLREAAPGVLRAVCETAGWDVGELWEVRQDSKRLECIDAWHVDGLSIAEFLAQSNSMEVAYGAGLLGGVWAAAEPAWIVDFDQGLQAPRSQLAQNAGLHCGFAFPIIFGTEVLGVAAFFSRFNREPDDGLLRMFESLGIQIGQFMERKKAEGRLRLFRALIDQARDFIEVVDPETGRYLDVNQQACEAHGFTRDEYLSFRVADIDTARVPSQTWEDIALCFQREGRLIVESRHRRKDGSEFPVEVNANIIRLDRDYLVAIVRDISERNQMEEHLRQSQKMEAVGRLAGGVAHDFNNLLTVINCHTELLIDKTCDQASLLEHCQAIQYAGNRAAELTAQLLAFSRRTFVEPKVLDLNEVVQSVGCLFARLIREDISLKFVLAPSVVRFKADRGQVDQIIMNLVVNARDAMPGGGELILETSEVCVGAEGTADYPEVKPGQYACLKVIDTGHGMSEETKRKIFEPFYTTKDVGKGTGLGLAVVHGVMTQCGGHVSVASGVGKGSTFQLLFPATNEYYSRETTGPVQDGVVATETILVVEDEESVCKVARIALEREGYNVLVADSGPQALKIIGEYSGTIHVVLTDVIMPEMSGFKLVEEIRSRRPDLKTILMSGHTDETIVNSGVVGSGDAFVEKPFTPASLLKRVRNVLEKN